MNKDEHVYTYGIQHDILPGSYIATNGDVSTRMSENKWPFLFVLVFSVYVYNSIYLLRNVAMDKSFNMDFRQ